MVDYKERVENSGLKLGYIAEQMGISRKTLWNKINGNSSFTRIEEEVFLMLTEPVNVMVADPKGELCKTIKEAGYESGNVVVFDLKDEDKGCSYLPLDMLNEFLAQNETKDDSFNVDDDVWTKAEMKLISQSIFDSFAKTVGESVGTFIGKVAKSFNSDYPHHYVTYFVDAMYRGLEPYYPEQTKKYWDRRNSHVTNKGE